ncbi:dimethylarginine dimethylaminohydrolase family protein [Sediminibacillus massiliensis]|uniref:dimethylarginine dimethylaminohydrolase family protein n=1 Tax=Sediminibacillus massiliensis TaxID=1926277 RepID=UPI000BAE3D93|nr:dimethylarginine dimethylaminohydrolase family protein [Sediminibacillus massiliensis]
MVLKPTQQVETTRSQNEYNKLEKVIVCPPLYMEIREIINETQRHYLDENIDVEKAKKQHQNFVEVLQKNGIEVITLPVDPRLNEQVFTRDIGFCIDDKFLISHMGSQIRQGELDVLKSKLQQLGISYLNPFTAPIEGGDVILENGRIFVGVSERTSRDSIEILAELFPEHEVIPLSLSPDILHLDCALNIIGNSNAVIYPEAFTKEDYRFLRKQYEVIEVSEKEQFTLGTNVLSVGGNKVLSLPQNQTVNEKMRERGFSVIEVDFSEIIKSGGSFRCCSLPIKRKRSISI